MPNVSFHIFVTPLYMKTTDKNNADTSQQIEKSIKKKTTVVHNHDSFNRGTEFGTLLSIKRQPLSEFHQFFR